MAIARRTPSYRLNWVTWLIASIVLLAFVSRQLEKEPGFAMANLGHLSESSTFGWPLVHLDYAESRPLVLSAEDSLTRYYREWHPWQLLANCLVALLLVVSTVFVCEGWVRANRRLQFSLRHALVMTAIVGVMMALSRERITPDRGSESFVVTWSFVGWADIQQPIRWPVLLGLACTIYFLGWLAYTSALCSCRVFRRIALPVQN
jgi:hypothetical protein